MSSPSKLPVCLVLGAGPGIGYSVARKWAANGYQVVVTRRGHLGKEELERRSKFIQKRPKKDGCVNDVNV